MNNKCSLELAKRLKELGVKQESEFYWYKHDLYNEWKIENKETYIRYNHLKHILMYSAFTVGELIEGLPNYAKVFIEKSGGITKTNVGTTAYNGNVADCLAQYTISDIILNR